MNDKYAKNLELVELAKEGDRSAQSELVENNIGLVRSIAARFLGRGTEYEDLIQIGSIGMIKAMRSFDPSYNTAFSTYAVPMIIGEIKRFLRDDSMIKISRDTKRRGAMIMRVREEYMAAHSRELRADELAELTGLSREEVVYALEAVSPVRSLQECAGGEEGGSFEDFVGDRSDEIERSLNRIALGEAVAALPPMQKNIVYLRYYKSLSQQQTARLLGISQVKVSREEKKIFASLKEAL